LRTHGALGRVEFIGLSFDRRDRFHLQPPSCSQQKEEDGSGELVES